MHSILILISLLKKYENFKSDDNLIKTFYIWESILKLICRRNLKTKLKEIQIPLPIINTEYLYQSPIEKIIYCKNPVEINILKDVVSQNILNCVNAGDINRAIKYINPQNVSTEENVIHLT